MIHECLQWREKKINNELCVAEQSVFADVCQLNTIERGWRCHPCWYHIADTLGPESVRVRNNWCETTKEVRFVCISFFKNTAHKGPPAENLKHVFVSCCHKKVMFKTGADLPRCVKNCSNVHPVHIHGFQTLCFQYLFLGASWLVTDLWGITASYGLATCLTLLATSAPKRVKTLDSRRFLKGV